MSDGVDEGNDVGDTEGVEDGRVLIDG